MFDEIRKNFFSLSGLSITLGVIGFLSGIVQLFIDINTEISIKWLLLTILVLSSICFILLKIAFDFSQSRRFGTSQESPIKFIPQDNMLIIRKNENFLNNILVGCYMAKEGVEQLILIGVVHHVQERLIQIKIIKDFIGESMVSIVISKLNNIIIRPVIPYSIIPYLNQQEEPNE